MRVKSYKAIKDLVYDGFPEADFPYDIKHYLTIWFTYFKKVSIFNTIKDNKELKPCLYTSGKKYSEIMKKENEILSNDGLSYYLNPERKIIIVYDDTPGLAFKWIIKLD